MNWKVKAALQHAVAMLPSRMSFAVYYRMQRSVGTLRSVNPIEDFENGVRLIDAAETAGASVHGKVFLEVGTGCRLNVPIALWLCGAARIRTVDLFTYLKESLVLEDLAYLRAHPDATLKVFGARAQAEDFQRRFAILSDARLDLRGLLRAAHIEYRTPVDARTLSAGNESVDFHISNNVMEHIPPTELRDILFEGRRVVKHDGLLLHRVDFSDHYAEADARISTVNFLQYSERQWRRYADNRYNYHNRLRLDELESLVADVGLRVVAEHADVDARAVRLLESGFAVDARFAGKPVNVNATQSVVMVLARGTPSGQAWIDGRLGAGSSASMAQHA
jgi:hypothetical protein